MQVDTYEGYLVWDSVTQVHTGEEYSSTTPGFTSTVRIDNIDNSLSYDTPLSLLDFTVTGGDVPNGTTGYIYQNITSPFQEIQWGTTSIYAIIFIKVLDKYTGEPVFGVTGVGNEDTSGYYWSSVAAGYTGTFIPEKDGYIFEESDISFLDTHGGVVVTLWATTSISFDAPIGSYSLITGGSGLGPDYSSGDGTNTGGTEGVDFQWNSFNGVIPNINKLIVASKNSIYVEDI
jgi:hypothetical protein